MNKLRDALSDSAEEPRYIETLPRRGYRFRAEVEWIGADAAISVQKIEAATQKEEESTQPVSTDKAIQPPSFEPPLPPSRTNWLRYGSAAGLMLATLFVAAVLVRSVSGVRAKISPQPVVERTVPLLSIANTFSPAFSPDGNRVAFYRAHSAEASAGIYVSAVGSDQLLQLTSNDDDCCPVWSPDARWIAFTREHNHDYSIYLVPSDGGGEEKRKTEQASLSGPSAFKVAYSLTSERKLDTAGVMPRRGDIDWSPDGKLIAFSGPDGLYLATLDNPNARRLSETPPLAEDWGPAFSPDGTKVVFVRQHQNSLNNEILSVSVSGGEWSHVFSEPGQISSRPQWAPDARSIIFSSNRRGHPAIFRVNLDSTPDSAFQMKETGTPSWDPAVSRSGYRLAYERLLRSLSIWQMDLGDAAQKHPYLLVSSTSDTDQGPGPQFSPDGKHLAYMSDRNGTMEIWIGNRDGSNAYQLTAVGGAGTPRWSPDSQSVVFDATTLTGSKILTMSLHGTGPQILTPGNTHSVCPSWSHDGRWIYFASPRSGDFQVWKVSAHGGEAIQVTRHGGHAPLESLDGKYLYYAKDQNADPEIWRVPVDGGEETPMPLVRPGTWASFQIVRNGILFVGPCLGHQGVLSFYDFATSRTTILKVLDKSPFWLGATPDGKTVAFDQPGQEQSQAMLVDNFR